MGKRQKMVILAGLLLIWTGVGMVSYWTYAAMDRPEWSTPAPNVQNISPTPWPTR